MNMFRNIMLSVFVFSLLFIFSAQAQIDDTTDSPSGTEFGTPIPPTQTDTAAHFKLATELADRLGQTITINAEQKNKIIERIVEFQENIAEVNMDMREGEEKGEAQEDLDAELVSLVDDIEGILDESQRADWIRMKDDWMTEVRTHIHSDRDVKKSDIDVE
jgi:hypothetical protein